jgi:hypothetical protein
MPLARVRTSLSNIPAELKQQLQRAGYEIEIVSPGKKISKAADLELTIESHPVQDAIAAASRANTVYVSSGALRRPEAVARQVPAALQPVPVSRDVEEQRFAQQQRVAEQRILEQRRAEQQAVEAERLRREQERIRQENERQVAEQRQVAREQAEQLRIEREQAERQEAEKLRAEQQKAEAAIDAPLRAERERVEAEARKQQRVLQMWREAEARHSQALDPEAIRLREEHRREEERKAELRRQATLAEEQRLTELRAEQQRQIREAEEEHRRWQAEQDRLRQEREQLRLELQRKQEEIHLEQQRLRQARERLVRDRLMADQAAERARQEAEATVAASAMNVASAPANVVPIAAAQSEQTAIVESTVIRTASGETANISVTPMAKGPEFVERRRHPRLPLIEGGARRLRHKEYRRAAFAAVGLTVLVMGLWIALAARQSASPLATGQLVRSAGVEQSSPFGPAKLNAPVQGGSPAVQRPQPVAQKQLAPAPQAAARPAQKKVSAAKPVAKRKSRSVRPATSDDGQEVVVRHFGRRPSATTTKKTASTKDGVKVFSDMD